MATIEEQKENQELRVAIRNAFLSGKLADVEAMAMYAGMTSERLLDQHTYGFIDGGWGDVFELFHIRHGRYPEQAETKQAAAEWRQAKLDHSHWSTDLGSRHPLLYGIPPISGGNPKAEFYEAELEAELNNLAKTVQNLGNDSLSDHVERIIFIFRRVKDSRKEGEGKS